VDWERSSDSNGGQSRHILTLYKNTVFSIGLSSLSCIRSSWEDLCEVLEL